MGKLISFGVGTILGVLYSDNIKSVIKDVYNLKQLSDQLKEQETDTEPNYNSIDIDDPDKH